MLQVDAVYCITLDSRNDRQLAVDQGLAYCGLADRVRYLRRHHLGDVLNIAKDHPARIKAGDLGCASSHRFAIDQAHRLGYSRILVFEDDAVRSDHFDEDLINLSLDEMDKHECDFMNLGGIAPDWRPGTPKMQHKRLCENLHSVRNMVTTHAIVYSHRVFSRILLNIPTFQELTTTFHNTIMSGAYDQWLHLDGGCAMNYPMFYQRDGVASDIVGLPHNVNFKDLTEQTYELLRASS